MAAPESPNALALGKAIRAAREKSGESQESVALKAGFHRNYYSDVERGNRNITDATLLKIAKALDVKASELLAQAGQKVANVPSRGNHGIMLLFLPGREPRDS